MKRILVLSPPEDRAGRAIALAGDLAARTHARVTVLRVLHESPRADAPPLGENHEQIRALLTESELQSVEAQATSLRDAGIMVDVAVEWGVAWQVAVARVERDRFDLVVKPASGLADQAPVFFGSTALHLFRRCPCPVWVVGDAGRLPSRVIAAVDPTEGDRRRQIAHSVLDWATEVADWLDAAPEIVSAWQALGASLFADREDDTEWKRHREDERERAEGQLNALLHSRREPVDPEHVHLREGEPAKVIPAFSQRRTDDLLVVGTLGRPDSIGDLIGETAETIIRRVRCSVLTVPPGSGPEAPRAATESAS